MGQDGSSDMRLPISPLMDDNFHEARQRHRQPKRKPDTTKLTPLQEAVRKNVYARALATPVRKCRLTGVMLPRFFLLGFHAIVNNKTGVPWYMPRGITNKDPMKEEVEEQDRSYIEDISYTAFEDDTIRQGCESDAGSEAKENSSSSTSMVQSETPLEHHPTTTNSSYRSKTFPPSTAKIGGGTYLLRSYQALDSLRTKSTKSSKGVPSLLFLTQNIRNSPFALETFNAARFRPDMADFVLTLKRRRVFDALILATRKFRGYISNFNPTRTLKTSQVAAVIIIGPPYINKDCDYRSVTEQEFHAYMEKSTKDVPIFDLRILLGDEMLQQLKNSDEKRWKTEVLTIKNRNYSQYLLERLWELEGYLTPFVS
ncbi:putative esterase-like protein [Golovinomyces cichoracearum]|uniref:Putative esterase-like protein n=1 Tax=Golovinomyces cichoracearum TaxID=62708 RepID=A0A420IW46_9PEZI|nr:putative esterase-like protein [Golovinomyces cichoracearum]